MRYWYLTLRVERPNYKEYQRAFVESDSPVKALVLLNRQGARTSTRYFLINAEELSEFDYNYYKVGGWQ